jgi:hypothetical protein
MIAKPMWTIPFFTAEVAGVAHIHKWYANRATELNTIATALSTDTTTHDKTMQAPPAALNPGLVPPVHSRFTNAVNLIVNKGKSGNLTAAAMGSAITAGIAQFLPPANTAAPVASSTSLSVAAAGVASVTNGTWTNAPTEYQYQWLRAGAPIFSATTASHTLVVADETFMISCRVTAINAGGSTSIVSNAIGPITA